MGVVYKARQISMARMVALKVLAPHVATDPELIARFMREAKASGDFQHPNLVRGLACGEDDGRYFFAMDLVDGEDAAKILSRLKQLAVGDAVKIAIDVAKALEHAALHDVVHRDIKPSNIIVSRAGVVKLTDLGIAKTTSEANDLTRTGAMLGTPTYMPPEQLLETKDVDVRADIYALGVTLYLLLAGCKPFRGTERALLEQKRIGSYEPAGRYNPNVPKALDQLLRKMMAPLPADRFQNATELIAALEATGLANQHLSFVVHEAQRGRPARRRTWRVAFGALAVSATLAGIFLVVRSIPGPPDVGASVARTEIDRILTRASGLVANADFDGLREVLTDGAARYPGAASLRQALAELDRGTLVLFQYQSPSTTSRVLPLWEAGGMALTSQDNYRFAVVSGRSCFFYAFQRDAQNQVVRLFPNEELSRETNPLSAGEIRWLPAADASGPAWLFLDATVGTERVYFVAVTKALRDPVEVSEVLTSPETTELPDRLERLIAADGSPAEPCFAAGMLQVFTFDHRAK
jgi:hypothetical protein